MRVRRGGGRITRGEAEKEGDGERERKRERSSLDPEVSRKAHERRTSSPIKGKERERERTEAARYSLIVSLSLYPVIAALHFAESE